MTDRTTDAPRFYQSAVATSALPLLALGSASTAAPAVADASGPPVTPKLATVPKIVAAQAELQAVFRTPDVLAALIPSLFTQRNFQAANTTPVRYKVKSGGTLC